MKNKITLKEFSDLSSSTVQVTEASAPAIPESSPPLLFKSGELGEDFRELLHQRYTSPFVSAIPYQHWGINE